MPGRIATSIAIGACLALGPLVSGCSGVLSPPPQAVVMERPPFPAPQPQALNPTTPEQVQAALVRWFTVHGYKPFQVEALADYARVESGFRPCAVGRGVRYAFQWDADRQRRLAEFSHTPGCPALDQQLAFADKELREVSKYSCFWQAQTRASASAALRRGFGGGSC